MIVFWWQEPLQLSLDGDLGGLLGSARLPVDPPLVKAGPDLKIKNIIWFVSYVLICIILITYYTIIFKVSLDDKKSWKNWIFLVHIMVLNSVTIASMILYLNLFLTCSLRFSSLAATFSWRECSRNLIAESQWYLSCTDRSSNVFTWITRNISAALSSQTCLQKKT